MRIYSLSKNTITYVYNNNCYYSFFVQQGERRNGWINVGDLQGAVHFKIVKYERIKFLVIALKDSIEIYAWAPKPYHKFMAFKSFCELTHRPLLVDLTVEEGTRLKVIYGSADGFHAVDLDSASVYDIYIPKHVSNHCCHFIVALFFQVVSNIAMNRSINNMYIIKIS